MKNIFKRLLNVKGMVVEDVSIVDSPLRDAPVLVARVRCRKAALRCSRCGRKCPKYDDGGGERRWRHQDFDCYRVEIVGPAPRVECRVHGVVVSRVPWAEPGSRFTRDFELECTWLMTVANRKTVSGFLHVAWRTAGDIAGRVAGRPESGMPCMFDGLTAIGVDETGHRKGHTYVTVVVDHERKRVVWAHDGYGKQVLDLFFEELTLEQRASIRIVTGDSARWIDSSVAEYRPNAERVLDSFHIVSWMTDCLDRVRKRLRNQARRAKDKTAAEAMKGLKYAVLGNPGDLTERQSTALATLAGVDPKGQLYRSWQLKELLRTLLHHSPPASRGGTQTMDQLGQPLAHPRDRRTMQEDPRAPGRHPQDHPTRLLQRAPGGVQQQDQSHHTHGLRLPPRRQPHRHDQTQMLRPTHPIAGPRPLTHDNSRSLVYIALGIRGGALSS